MPHSKTPSVYSPEFIERFWSKVAVGERGECWLWQQSTAKHGYGQTWDGQNVLLAHRVAWEIVHGPIPPGMSVLHHCDVRPCVNAYDHLFLGTDADNAMDKARKLRIPIAKLNPENVREMRRRYAEGGVSTRQLAAEYGVDRRAIVFALKGRFWAHVEGGELKELAGPRIGKSGYRGVSQRWDGVWRARVRINNREISFGAFATPEEAARAYDVGVRELLGDRARLNFPEEKAA